MALTVEQNREVIKAAIRAMAALDQALLLLQGACSSEDFDGQRRSFGKAMGEITGEILQPLFQLHPELEPQTAEEWRIAGDLPKAE